MPTKQEKIADGCYSVEIRTADEVDMLLHVTRELSSDEINLAVLDIEQEYRKRLLTRIAFLEHLAEARNEDYKNQVSL